MRSGSTGMGRLERKPAGAGLVEAVFSGIGYLRVSARIRWCP
jgi:hypothetical protein